MNSELNVLGLVLGASVPVKLVLGILIVFSVASWFIIFRKKALIDRANASADEFEERFWSGADLAGLFKDVSAGDERITGSAAIFEAGFREFARLRQRRGVDSRTLLEGAQRAMRVASMLLMSFTRLVTAFFTSNVTCCWSSCRLRCDCSRVMRAWAKSARACAFVSGTSTCTPAA